MSGSLTEAANYTAQGRLTLRDELEQPTCVEEGNAGTLCDAPGGMPFAFNSQWRSPRTGLVNMRARWYSPKLGQFTSHDPLGYVDTQNLYAFAAFDPINSWDPYGLEAQDQTEHPGDFNPPSNYNPDESWACQGVPFAIGCWLDNATRSTERGADDVAKKRRKAVKRERKKAQKKLRDCQEGGDAHCAGEKAQLLTVEVAEEVLPDTGPGVAQLGAEAAGGGAASATTKAGKEAIEQGSKGLRKLMKRLHRDQSGGVGISKRAIPPDGTQMTTNEALETAADFLGAGYTESHPGIFVSADGKRRVRMTTSDLADPNGHAPGPHLNFELGTTTTKKNGKSTFKPKENHHIYIDEP